MPEITKEFMISRIQSLTSALGWEKTVQYILKKKIPFEHLHIAEVGCGTGTFSLIFGLLGAKVVLIDNDPKVIEMAKKVFNIYECRAEFIQMSVLDTAPEFLRNRFDLVVSGGLAEHFRGDDRLKCIAFHEALLREGGFVFIGVPNKLSPFYQIVRLFRIVTGTWRMAIEIPFSYRELTRTAEQVGLAECEVVGNHPLRKDLVIYSLGLISAILELFPDKARRRIRTVKSKKSILDNQNYDARKEILNKISSIKEKLASENRRHLKDFLSAGIILFGSKDISNADNKQERRKS
jgi:2-polyprenyl-3-methyl-5-hydroxy-6-metoxy-1,4-benzoquinol methylase